MATQMQLDIFLAGNRMATRSFREKKKKKTASKSSLLQSYFDFYIHVDNRERSRASDQKQRRRISSEENHKNLMVAVRKWEMLGASKERPARWKWEVVKKKLKRTGAEATKFFVSSYDNSSIKPMCNGSVNSKNAHPPSGHLSGIRHFVLEKLQMSVRWGRAFIQKPHGGA